MTSREIGSLLGVSHTAINKAARKGRIPRETDGSFDLEKVRAVWGVNVDQRQRRARPEKRTDNGHGTDTERTESGRVSHPTQPVEKLRKGPAKENSGADPESLYEATRQREWIRVGREKLELAKRKGEVMLVADVEKLIAGMIGAARGRLLLLPDKIAPRVAVISNVLECRAIMEQAVREALSALSESNAA